MENLKPDQFYLIHLNYRNATLFSQTSPPTPVSTCTFQGVAQHLPIDTCTWEPLLQAHILFKIKITWGKEADLLLLRGTSHDEELFHVKDNCINEIFMCSHYMKTLRFYNQDFVQLSLKNARKGETVEFILLGIC